MSLLRFRPIYSLHSLPLVFFSDLARDLAYLLPRSSLLERACNASSLLCKALTTCRKVSESIGTGGDVRLFYFYFPIDLFCSIPAVAFLMTSGVNDDAGFDLGSRLASPRPAIRQSRKRALSSSSYSDSLDLGSMIRFSQFWLSQFTRLDHERFPFVLHPRLLRSPVSRYSNYNGIKLLSLYYIIISNSFSFLHISSL